MKLHSNNLKVETEKYVALIRDLINGGVFERIFRERFSSVFYREEWVNALLEYTPDEIVDKLYPMDGMFMWMRLNGDNTVSVKDNNPQEATWDLENGTIRNWPYAKVEIRNPINKLYLLLAHQYGSWLAGKVRCEPGEFHLLDDYIDCVKTLAMDKHIRDSARMIGGWTSYDEAKLCEREAFVAKRADWFYSRVVLEAEEQFSDID